MRILIAIDITGRTDEVLHFSAQIASRAIDMPTVLIVIEQKIDRVSSKVEEILARAHKLLDVPDLISKVRFGDPAEEIIRETEEGIYDLVIIGEQQMSHLPRLFRDSESVRVAEHAACPTIIVKGNIKPIRRILLCDSGSGRSMTLRRFTSKLAEMLEGEEAITILHVMSQISAGPGVSGGLLRANAEELIGQSASEGELLDRDAQDLEQPGIHPIPKVRHGFVVDEILAEARYGDYDLVVIGAFRFEGWQRFLLDDLARKVLIQVDRPVLVVR